MVRTAEGRDVAHVITTALAEGWSVARARTPTAPRRGGRAGSATSRILVPARTSLPFLEDALERGPHPLPGRVAARSSTPRRAVRDLLMVLRAADDPTDHLRIVAALRTPLLGCGDDDLFTHKVLQGRALVVQHARAARRRGLDRRAGPGVPARRSTRRATGTRPPSCSTASPATAAPSSSGSPRAAHATCGAACGS